MKPVVIAAIVAVVAIGGFLVINSGNSSDNSSNNDSSANSADTGTQTETTETTTDMFDAATVAQHAAEDDCWTIIDGGVYDITSYIPRHPGGDEVLLACGADGTSLFNQRRTTDGETVGTGKPHSNKASTQLDDLKIGDLAQ